MFEGFGVVHNQTVIPVAAGGGEEALLFHVQGHGSHAQTTYLSLDALAALQIQHIDHQAAV